jgi:alanyl-tRNA synthetase
MMLTAADIRRRHLDFFVARGHTEVASAPLVPADDPTIMFTVAGMVQFKALYSGAVPLPYARAATCQKCLRAGGKGSDLENVGKTLRHFTFFEMLGNFSFGDYFKRDTIVWAWDLCTSPEGYGLPADRIWPTIYGKPNGPNPYESGWSEYDEEAEAIWRDETGVVNPIIRLDAKENFWGPAGETGACGPCSEIKFFMGSDEQLREYQRLAASDNPADRQKVAHDLVELGDLFLEIWNLVFPQFDQQPDGSRPPLKNRGIDTGLGLERTTTAVQFIASGGAINTPYETDLLRPMVDAVAAVAGLPYPTIVGGEAAEKTIRERGLDPAAVRLAINACTDHARTVTFALAEGIVPSNEGRGYVIRRILRRAARFGKKIGVSDPFLWRLVEPIVRTMGAIYPELNNQPDYVKRIIRSEEERFNRTLNQGGEILVQNLKIVFKTEGKILSGTWACWLYETHGYPLDLIIESAEEFGVSVNVTEFEAALKKNKEQSRASWVGGSGNLVAPAAKIFGQGQVIRSPTKFVGYDRPKEESKVLELYNQSKRVDQLNSGEVGVVILNVSPFYAEAGGQIGDQGTLEDADGFILFDVEDTRKNDRGVYLHLGKCVGSLKEGQVVMASVDEIRRAATIRNHSAVHLMQGALKRLIGSHVTQQGSWVGPEGLRFDFTNPEAVNDEQQRAIEALVNEQIRRNLPVTTNVMDLETARKSGAIAPFEEKYGATVRVLSMGEGDECFSKEFCGGTHVSNTGDIGRFMISRELSVASGIRRIEAVAGEAAAGAFRSQVALFDRLTERLAAAPLDSDDAKREALIRLTRLLSVPPDAIEERIGAIEEEIARLRGQIPEATVVSRKMVFEATIEDRIAEMQQEIKNLRRQVEDARAARAREQMVHAAGAAREIAGVKFIAQALDGADHNMLAQAWDALKGQSSTATVGLFHSVVDGKVNMIVGVTDDLAGKKLKAGDLLNAAASVIGGKGGGRPNLARGGGNDPSKIDEAISAAAAALENALK